MLTKIARFEIRYQMRSPLFFVGSALFFLLTFAAVTIDQIQIGGKGNVNVNSPYAIVSTLSAMNLFGVFVLTAFVANVVIRDDETGFAPILRATRITKLDYLLGRFLGASTVAFLVMAFVPLGMVIGSAMPWLDQEKVGPFVPFHYLFALFVYVLPTLLLMGAGFFALATATRSMMWTYLGVVAFFVLFVTSRVLLSDPAHETLATLTDPFGLSALRQTTKYWTAADRNTMLPPLAGMVLYNRLIWLTVAVGLFVLAYVIFRFDDKGKREGFGKKQRKKLEADPAPVDSTNGAIKYAPPATRPSSAIQQFLALARFDIRFVWKSPAFFVLLILGVFNAFGGLTSTVENRGTEFFPVTRVMVEVLQGAFTIIPMIIAVYYAGELVWRDRERRIHEIVDSTSAPDWAFVAPKVLAIAMVLVATFSVAVVTAVLYQLAHGYTHLELRAYLLWFLVPSTVSAFLLGALAVFAQALSPHKFVGWGVMLLYIIASVTLGTLGFEHNLYNYAGEPSVPLSDMNGLGHFWIGRAWFQIYWLSFAAILLLISHLMWRRGVDSRLKPRFLRLRTRLRGLPGVLLGLCVATFVGVGAFNYYNTNILNKYTTTPQDEDWQANYEKTLLGFESVPQPRIADVKLAVDLFPRDVRAVTNGSYVLENRTNAPIPELHLHWDRDLQLTALDVPAASLKQEWKEFHYRIYTLATPMQPGEKRTITFGTLLEQRGFPNGTPLRGIVENGTFLNNMEIAPFIGVDRNAVLHDRTKRRKHGLPAELRIPKLEDTAADAHQYLRHDSDWVTADLQVTTDADQTPVAPGYRISDVTENGRRTLKTHTEAPIQHFFSIQSARYAVKSETWTSKDGKPVELSVYYHPPHDHNVQRMLDAMKTSMDVYTEAFSPFQFRQARILEFPAYASFAQSFANTVPFSESIGFIQNYHEARSDDTIDLVTYVTAHEIGHQWWAHQIIGADKQGMTMLSESFAQYSALLVMEKLYGKPQIRKFLKGELDGYLRSRGSEAIEEEPLARVENQQYIHYQKGSLVMYWLKEVVGVDVVNRALQKLLGEFAFKPAPYPSSADFLRLLRAEAGPTHEQLISDLFEKITLYDLKATDAKAKKRPDGKYEVTFTVTAKKLYADGKGKETEAPLDEPFDLGAFTEEPGKKGYRPDSLLLLERRNLKSDKQVVTLVVDKEPTLVGVDPFNERIDRNSDDNLAKVELE